MFLNIWGNMNILFASSEAVPFSKTGGLGDVSGILPKEISRNENITLIIPYYKNETSPNIKAKKIDSFDVIINNVKYKTEISKKRINKKFNILLVSQDLFFARKFVYGDSSTPYPDNFYRFLFFQKAIINFIMKNKIIYDIIHINDWQTSLIPMLSKYSKNSKIFKNSVFILSIHNLAFQGVFEKYHFKELEIPDKLFSPDYIEYYNKINFLKAGIIFSDSITTVSPTYAKEILKPVYGYGLDGLLKKYSFKLTGISNGVDYKTWDPENDPLIYKKYSIKTLANKKLNKIEFYKEFNLPFKTDSILAIAITRLSKQKGIELLVNSFNKLRRENINILILGKGDSSYESVLAKISKKSKKIKFLNIFDEQIAHKMQAAADILLMPSIYEPCGLTQMYSLKYGTVPIVRSTGGLADTIENYMPRTQSGTGFKFRRIDPNEFALTIKKALKIFQDKNEWKTLQINGMSKNFSWTSSANNYLNLYKKLLKKEKINERID